jgi:hypothetical protein
MPDKEEMRAMSVRLPADVHAKLHEIQLYESEQQSRQVSRNEIICNLIRSYSNGVDKPAKKKRAAKSSKRRRSTR